MSTIIVDNDGGGGGGTGNILSINTDVTPVQTLTTGTAGLDFNIVDNFTGDHKFNLPVADATHTGKLSSADWIRFNAASAGISYDMSVNVGDIFVAKRTGASTLGKAAGISEALVKALEALVSFTNTIGTVEIGVTVNNFTLNWAYNRNSDNPASQTINNGIGAIAVGLRTRAVVAAGLTTDTTYTISAVGDDVTWGASVGNPSSLNTDILFRPKIYWGVNSAVINTGAGIMAAFAASGIFASSRAFFQTFDASVMGGNNYLYVAYPSAYLAPASTLFNGFTFTDYTSVTSPLTNASGYTQNYIILRTNNVYSGAALTWQIL